MLCRGCVPSRALAASSAERTAALTRAGSLDSGSLFPGPSCCLVIGGSMGRGGGPRGSSPSRPLPCCWLLGGARAAPPVGGQRAREEAARCLAACWALAGVRRAWAGPHGRTRNLESRLGRTVPMASCRPGLQGTAGLGPGRAPHGEAIRHLPAAGRGAGPRFLAVPAVPSAWLQWWASVRLKCQSLPGLAGWELGVPLCRWREDRPWPQALLPLVSDLGSGVWDFAAETRAGLWGGGATVRQAHLSSLC